MVSENKKTNWPHHRKYTRRSLRASEADAVHNNSYLFGLKYLYNTVNNNHKKYITASLWAIEEADFFWTAQAMFLLSVIYIYT